MPSRDVERMAVVVPARDEEQLLARTLDAIAVAVDLVALPVEVVVVANGCSDATAEIAREHGADVIDQVEADVGRARAAGACRAMRRGVEGLWLASTDADSVVPAHWLQVHAGVAAAGCDLLLGTVRLTDDDAARHPWWSEHYASGRRHVHGANLGVWAPAYRRAGGYRSMPAHEDVDLVRRLRSDGAIIAWSEHAVVTTSARTRSRAPAGVGADLARGGVAAAMELRRPSA